MTQFPLFLIATAFVALTLMSSLTQRPAGDGPFASTNSVPRAVAMRAHAEGGTGCEAVPVCFGPRRPAAR